MAECWEGEADFDKLSRDAREIGALETDLSQNPFPSCHLLALFALVRPHPESYL